MPAGLAPLALNPPGSTKTHALVAGSLAIDGVPLKDCSDAAGNFITTDQRGVPRPQGAPCDIGAFELTSADAIQNLIITIANNMGLPKELADNLIAPLSEASALLNDNNPNNDIAACDRLGEFGEKVYAKYQNGKLTEAQASKLLQAGDAILGSLGC